MFKFSVNINKDNDKLKKKIVDLKDYIEFLENRNKIIGEEMASIRRESLK